MNDEYDRSLNATLPGGGQIEQGRSGKGATPLHIIPHLYRSDAYGCSRQGTFSILFLARLLARAFASKCGLHAFLLSGLQVKGVSFDLLDNIFLLHLALETAQRIFEGFSLLQANFSQTNTPPDSSG
jgi:hypothetical protein